MKITRKSIWSDKTRTMDLLITQEQFDAWQGGVVIQKAMPDLTKAEREFIISGMTDEEWKEMCGHSSN